MATKLNLNAKVNTARHSRAGSLRGTGSVDIATKQGGVRSIRKKTLREESFESALSRQRGSGKDPASLSSPVFQQGTNQQRTFSVNELTQMNSLMGKLANGMTASPFQAFTGSAQSLSDWIVSVDSMEPDGSATYWNPKGPSSFSGLKPPAPITLSPTSTTHPRRPRTVAAGYDEDNQYLTVVFRDGTFVNYPDTSPEVWEEFKRAPSKGKYIRGILEEEAGPWEYAAGNSRSTGRKTLHTASRSAQRTYDKRAFRTGRDVLSRGTSQVSSQSR